MLGFILGVIAGWFIHMYYVSVKEDRKKLDDDLEFIKKKLGL